MKNGCVPEYFDVDEPLTNVEGLPWKEQMEQWERDMAQNRWYMEWNVRRDKELEVTTKTFLEELDELERYEKHGILPTLYPELVNGYPPWPPEHYQRKYRAIDASNFTTGYKFVEGIKGAITSEKPLAMLSVKCFDSTWVAVHGMDSICVVTRRQIMDMTRLAPFYQEFSTTQVMCGYAEAIISLVECLPYATAYNDDDLRLRFGSMIEKPFSALSIVADNKKVNEGSSHEDISYEYDVTQATMFLEEKMKFGAVFTIDETIQAAIIAFQHLCHWELKADDLWVTYMKFSRNGSLHLCLDKIKDHFAVIKGSSSAVAPNSFFFGYHPSLECDDESENLPGQDFHSSLKCDYESDNLPNQDFHPSLKCDYESDNQPNQDFHPSLKCDYESDNQPSPDFLVSRFSCLSII